MENLPPEDPNSKSNKPCRACTDFKSWSKSKMKSKDNSGQSPQEDPNRSTSSLEGKNCPVDKDDLGRNTWSFLHTMAAYYPDKPTSIQEKEMTVFMKIFAKYYPCDHCAKDFRKSINHSPPETSSRWNLSQWLCKMHNEVNRKLGKEEFDCSLVDQRWKDGWEDGSCD